jgi:hypothetical protein
MDGQQRSKKLNRLRVFGSRYTGWEFNTERLGPLEVPCFLKGIGRDRACSPSACRKSGYMCDVRNPAHL